MSETCTVIDPESGEVTAVTVIEAGPCPVVQVKTVETAGYEAVQIAFDAVADRKISKAEQGHLAKAGAPARRPVAIASGASSAEAAMAPGPSAENSAEKRKKRMGRRPVRPALSQTMRSAAAASVPLA